MDTLALPVAKDLIPNLRGNIYTTGTTPPTAPIVGQIWVDTTTAATPIIKQYTGSLWTDINTLRPSARVLHYRSTADTAGSTSSGTPSAQVFNIAVNIAPATPFEVEIAWSVGNSNATVTWNTYVGLMLNTTRVNDSDFKADPSAYCGRIAVINTSARQPGYTKISVPSRAAGGANKMGMIEWYGTANTAHTALYSGRTMVGHSNAIPKDQITNIGLIHNGDGGGSTQTLYVNHISVYTYLV